MTRDEFNRLLAHPVFPVLMGAGILGILTGGAILIGIYRGLRAIFGVS